MVLRQKTIHIIAVSLQAKMHYPWIIYSGPLAAAIIAVLLLRAAAWLVFHPLSERRILGMRCQGWLWRARPELTAQLADAAAGAFSVRTVADKLGGSEAAEKIMPLAEAHIDQFLRVRLVKAMPVVGMFVGDKTINQLKELFMVELRQLFPEIMGKFVSDLEQDIDIRGLVVQKLNAIPEERVYAIITESLAKHWRLVQLFAAFIGLLAGLVQLLFVLMATA